MLLLLVELSQLSHLEKIIDKALQKGGCQKGGCTSLALTDSYNTSYTLQQITFPYKYLTLQEKHTYFGRAYGSLKEGTCSNSELIMRQFRWRMAWRQGVISKWSRAVTRVRVMSYPYKGLNLLKHTMNPDLNNDLCTKKPDIYIYRYVYICITSKFVVSEVDRWPSKHPAF